MKEQREKLKKQFPPVHENSFYHHCTIRYKPKTTAFIHMGTRAVLYAYGRLTTDKVDVLLVHDIKSANKYPHITLSTAKGIRPGEAKAEIEANIHKIERFDGYVLNIEVIEGIHDGRNRYTIPLANLQPV